MRSCTFVSRKQIMCCLALVYMCGCSGHTSAPIIPGGNAAFSKAALRTPADAPSSMMPDLQGQDLLYVSNVRTVTVYTYPQGKLVGKLGGFYRAVGECVSRQGDVFITNQGTDQIFEYAHGSKIRKRVLAGYGGPIGCSVDSTTGNLAASGQCGGGSCGAVAIYKNARGKPKLYKDPSFKEYFFCGYDNKGDLFVDGLGSGSTFQFAELPKGGPALQDIALDQSITWPGGVEWDGKYVVVEDNKDQTPVVIHRFRITKNSGHEIGSTSLGSPAFFVPQFWIEGSTLVAPNYKGGQFGQALFYHYPAGGKPSKEITAGIKYPNGAAVSPAQTHS